MSRLDNLLSELCPDGVEHRPLGDLADLTRGKSLTKAQVTPGPVPVIAGGRSPAYYHTESNRTGETVVIAGSGASAGFVSWWDQPIWVSDAFSVVPSTNRLSTRFCYYFLLSQQEYLHSLKTGGGVPHVYPKQVAKISCPIPPLEVQEEIVRILDAFTELEAQLQAELEAQEDAIRKQYEYYRDLLLTFEEKGS